MKNFKFVIILFLSVVILFSMYKYASDEKLIEDMSNGKYMCMATIINNPNTSPASKIRELKTKCAVIRNEKIIYVLSSNTSDEEKVRDIQALLNNVTL